MKPIHKRPALILGLILVLALMIGGCSAPAAPAAAPSEGEAAPAADTADDTAAATGTETGKSGGDLVFGRYADSLFLDPVLNDANLDIWVLNSLYDTLFQSTQDGAGIEPMLATGYEAAEDALSYAVTLRDGIKFADGSDITVDDVVWSLDRARNPENGIWNFSLESVESVEAVGDNQVVLNLSRPDPSIPAALAMFNSAVMPKALFEAMPGETDEEKAKAFSEQPVGSGPFVLTEWVRGSHMVMERNPYYWQTDADGVQLPYLDSVRFEIIPEDATRILKLQAGELDVAEFIPLSRVSELEADANVNMELFPSTKVSDILMNNRPEFADGTANPLSDVRVRQALNYAVNKDALIQLVTFGTGVATESYMSSTTPLFSPQEMYPYNPDKAKELLAEAGYADGFEISSMALSGNADSAALLLLSSRCGLTLALHSTSSSWIPPHITERYRANDFQIAFGLLDQRHQRSQPDHVLLRHLRFGRIAAHRLPER